MESDQTGIDFRNQVDYTDDFNPYIYKNFYNGGGVAIGDINNDGFSDIFFSGNLTENKLYLNKGDFEFQDVTESAGVSSRGVWSTGVSFVDINGDGFLDIYVCKSGTPKGDNRHNEFFINNGDLTFSEKAKEFGIADLGLSVHAAFFDYDKDGDLDCYLLNNSIRSVGGYDLIKDQREIRDPLGGNKLYRNESELTPEGVKVRFKDVSEEAGIYGSQIGFGLGVAIGDVNKDGWQDIFISNDFFERDYLYINDKNGAFKEQLEDYLGEISLGSMGADIADVNNDGYPEIFVTEMLPEDDARIKTTAVLEDWDKYQLNVERGYYHQFPRNVLQLNNSGNSFSEIGRLSGVYATDWSWGALILDMDNDGLKDLYVANGIYKDLTDHDYINYMVDPSTVRRILVEKSMGPSELFDRVPSNPIVNYAFHNQGDLSFENKAEDWGLSIPSFSNGSAYGDLDNDGDLDLVVSNVNMEPFVIRNNSDEVLDHRYLMLKLIGNELNTSALGARVTLKEGNQSYYQELAPFRGFQSTVDHKLHFGLNSITEIDSLIIEWPDNSVSVMQGVPTDQLLTISQENIGDVAKYEKNEYEVATMFEEITSDLQWPLQHIESEYIDFDRERLLFHMRSNEGPRICKGDVNGDRLEDIFIPGAKEIPSALFVQQNNSTFKKTNEKLWMENAKPESTGCIFFDADNDNDLDLYVTNGGNEVSSNSPSLIDQFYKNDGKGNFSKVSGISSVFESTSSVEAADYDGDGDLDLFLGGRMKPFLYGVSVSGRILNNDGEGNFTDVTKEKAPQLLNVGHITDGRWFDYDQDSDLDLVIVGEWMPIKVFSNEENNFVDVTSKVGLDNTNGFWHSLEVSDLDKDGDLDLVVGNLGLNTRLSASVDRPMTMYVNDFDQNGTAEQIIDVFENDKAYPLVQRDDLLMQIPELKKKYPQYSHFKEQTVNDIFSKEQLEGALKYQVYELRSGISINNGDGTFSFKALPVRAQFSVTYAIEIEDFNGDGNLDLLLGGNLSKAKPEVGVYKAAYGEVMLGDGRLNFRSLSPKKSGFHVKGEIRDFLKFKSLGNDLIIVALNNDKFKIYKY